jgi:hypothetical protein
MNRFITLFALLTVLIPIAASAESNIYRCYVVSDAFIKADGSLELIKDSPRIGEEFTVIKKTGEIVGDVMDSLKNPKIIDGGRKKQPYKVIWQQKSKSTNGIFIDYLSIDESTGRHEKPFGFFSGSLLLSGLCQ